jgi:rRNA-processing protein FCF1
MKRAGKAGAVLKSRPRLIIDTNLLLLTVVGTVDPALIGKFDRTKKYTVGDYDAVVSEMPRYSKLVITPGIAVETGNWIGYLKGIDYEAVWNRFCTLVGSACEIPVPSLTSCGHVDALRLGITDCSILIAAANDIVVLTDDRPLHKALCDHRIKALHLEQLR